MFSKIGGRGSFQKKMSVFPSPFSRGLVPGANTASRSQSKSQRRRSDGTSRSTDDQALRP